MKDKEGMRVEGVGQAMPKKQSPSAKRPKKRAIFPPELLGVLRLLRVLNKKRGARHRRNPTLNKKKEATARRPEKGLTAPPEPMGARERQRSRQERKHPETRGRRRRGK